MTMANTNDLNDITDKNSVTDSLGGIYTLVTLHSPVRDIADVEIDDVTNADHSLAAIGVPRAIENEWSDVEKQTKCLFSEMNCCTSSRLVLM